MAEYKTNAMRILEKANIPYRAHTYDAAGGIDAVSVAQKVGMPEEQIYKTLVTKGKSGGYFVFVIAAGKELDLKKAAQAVKEKAVDMIPVKDLLKVTGYIRGGCSPIGMKKTYPTVLDSAAEQLPQMVVSAGKIGYQVELSPEDLARVSGADFCNIVV